MNGNSSVAFTEIDEDTHPHKIALTMWWHGPLYGALVHHRSCAQVPHHSLVEEQLRARLILCGQQGTWALDDWPPYVHSLDLNYVMQIMSPDRAMEIFMAAVEEGHKIGH